MTKNRLIYGVPAENPDLAYALGATSADPIIYLEAQGKPCAVVPNTEIDEMKRKARVRRIFPYSDFFRKMKSLNRRLGESDMIRALLNDFRIKTVEVHPYMPAILVDQLRKSGIKVNLGTHPFCPKRLTKTPTELQKIAAAQKVTFQAIGHVASILKASRISGSKLYYKGKVLTSEFLHAAAKTFLVQQGYDCPTGIIIACGDDSTEPHNAGHGPVRPHQSVIVDIFPQNAETRFFGDATRTFCKGKPSRDLQLIYLAVREAQEMALRMIRPGVNGQTIHTAIQEFFNSLGFTTRPEKGRLVGFFHGTGHGLGLALHEDPVRISSASWVLKPGNVVTVEPGLYYPGIGGVRIEDVVVVTKTGCKIIGSFPKKLVV